MRKWKSVELSKADAELLKLWCNAKGIVCQRSSCYNLVLCEVYASESEINLINAFLRTI